PLLEALARRAGPVDVVTTPAALPLVATHPAVRRAIPYDKRGQDRGMAAFLALARALRAERYEAAYLPHRSLRSGALAWLARIPRRVGFHDGWPLLYTEVRRRPTDGHESDRLLALAGEAPHSFAPRLWPPPARYERQGALASRDRDGPAGRRGLRTDDPGIRVRPAPGGGGGGGGGRKRGARGARLSPLLRPRPARVPARPPQVHARAVRGSGARRHRGDRCATSSGLTSAGRTSSPGPSRRTAPSSSGSCRSRRSPSRAPTRSWRAS